MKKIILSTIIILTCANIQAQEDFFATGLLPDDGRYEQLPRKADLITRDYTVLPESYSLKKYCPIVKSQSSYGTCTSWATAYAARTIAEAIRWGWTDKNKITQESFSPIFVYAQIKDRDDSNCQKGSFISDALNLMKNKGVCKFSAYNVLCASYVNSALLTTASQYKIDDFFTLFSINFSNGNEKVRKVKKALSEDCPVVIAMWIPSSFHQAKSAWNGMDVDTRKHGYHAMCVIGYDNAKNGGSFQIMNSWGANWGESGFVWVKYSDFAKYVDQAYEIYVKKQYYPEPLPEPKPTPKPKPKPIPLNELSGEITLQLATGEKMIPVLDKNSGIYRIAEDYISGTRYRIYISNNEPAYVYVIGSDMGNNVSKVFPPKDNISAALTYKSNHIAIPDETYYVEMDNTTGKDYMCVLYSKEALNIADVINKIKLGNGSFYDKVKNAVSGKMASPNDIRYVMNSIGFSAKTNKTVVPIIVEIGHK